MPGPFDGRWKFVFNQTPGFLRPDSRPIQITDSGSFYLTFPLEGGDFTIQVQSSGTFLVGSRQEPGSVRYRCVGHLVTSLLNTHHIAGVLWRVRPGDPIGEVEDTGSFTAIKQGNVEPSDSQG